MPIIWMFLLGLVVALLCKAFWPRHALDDTVVAVLLGTVGAVAAGLTASFAGLAYVAGGLPVTVASVLGAMLVLYVHVAVRSRSRHGGANA